MRSVAQHKTHFCAAVACNTADVASAHGYACVVDKSALRRDTVAGNRGSKSESGACATLSHARGEHFVEDRIRFKIFCNACRNISERAENTARVTLRIDCRRVYKRYAVAENRRAGFPIHACLRGHVTHDTAHKTTHEVSACAKLSVVCNGVHTAREESAVVFELIFCFNRCVFAQNACNSAYKRRRIIARIQRDVARCPVGVEQNSHAFCIAHKTAHDFRIAGQFDRGIADFKVVACVFVDYDCRIFVVRCVLVISVAYKRAKQCAHILRAVNANFFSVIVELRCVFNF